MRIRLAFDRASARTTDGDGHLHVSENNISKANVSPYLGREISGSDDLGLDPDRVYMMLRDPEELAKAAPSFDGKPLMFSHQVISSGAHPSDEIVGAVMNPRFEAPYLKAELVIWPDHAIKAIESDARREISCGYYYTADMTPGVYEGEPYDGVMRNIRGNHVALVSEGRVGKEAAVADGIPAELQWAALEYALLSI